MIAQSQPLQSLAPPRGSASSSFRSRCFHDRARTRLWFAVAFAIVDFLQFSLTPWISDSDATWVQHEYLALRTTFIHTAIWWACMLVADAASPSGAPRKRAYMLMCLAAAAMSTAIWTLPYIEQLIRDRSLSNELANGLWQEAMYAFWRTALATVAYYYFLYGQSGRFALQQLRLDRIRVVRESTKAQLQAMQARVNPGLLISTLKDVERQCDNDPAAADHVLDCLIAYLRASTPSTAETTLTLATEMAVAQSFLDLAAARYCSQLTYTIDVSDNIQRTVPMPAMLLMPLVEYASALALRVKGPALLTLATDIDSRRQCLVVTVQSTGSVPDDECAGVMDALSERLHDLYGSAATLRRINAPPGMTGLSMEIPDERTERSDR